MSTTLPSGTVAALPGRARTFRWGRALTGLLAAGALSLGTAQAQVNAYAFAQTSGTYVPLTGGTVVATAASGNTFLDTSTFPATIPFSFVFNGTAYTTVNINSNGALTFGAPSTSSTPISTTITYAGAISVLGRDNQGRRVAPLGEISTGTEGSGTARTFVVQFSNFARFGTGNPGAANDNFNFQVRLNETTNTINLVYGAFTFDGTSSTTAQVGLRGVTNADFNNRTITSAGSWAASTAGTANSSSMFLSAAVKPTSGLTYTFTPSACAAPAPAVSCVSTTSAQVNFTTVSGDTYTVTTSPATTTQTVSTTPVTLSGLTAATTYSVRVVRNCAGGTTSAANTASFTTSATANDDPAGAIALPLTATCTPTSGTNVGATTTAVNGYANPSSGCGIASTPKDVWYQFVTDASGAGSTGAVITVTGNPAGIIRMFSAASCAGPFTQVGCTGGTTNNTTAPALTVLSLTPSTTYYVFVSGYGSGDTQGAFTICATVPASCAPPTAVAANTITTASANITFVAGNGNTSYSVTATPATGSPVTAMGSASPIALTGLAPNTTYSTVVTATCATAGGTAASAPFSFTTQANIPANDDPAGAIALGALSATCTPLSTTNAGATTTTVNGYTNPGTSPANCGIAASPKDVWYTFATDATGVGATGATITVTGVPASQIRVFSAASSAGPFTQIGCSSTSSTAAAAPLTLSGLAASTTYYVRISGYGSTDTQGAFTICATLPPACSPPTGVAASNNVTGNSINATFTGPGSGNTSFTATATPTAGGTAISNTGTASPIALTGLTPSTAYSLVVAGNCGAAGASPAVTFTTPALAPANDNPAGAIALGALSATCTSLSTTNAGASTTTVSGYTNPGCGAALSPKDVWYTFATNASGAGSTTATVTVSGTPAGQVRVFSATSSAGPFTQVGCANGTTNNTQAPPLNLAGLTPSTTYYVFVSGYGSSDTQGAFTICATVLSDVVVTNANSSPGTPFSATGVYNNLTIASGGTANTVGTVTILGTLTVQDGGRLNVTTNNLVTGSGNFDLQAGGTLGIATSTGIAPQGTTAGAIQTTGSVRNFSTGANYVYQGTSSQSTGLGLPATVRSLSVNNSSGVTLSQATGVAQTLTLTSGSLASNGNLTLLSNATGTALVVNAGSGTVTGTSAMQRYIDPSLNAGLGYRHFSAPVAAQTFGGLAAGGFAPNLNTAYNTSPDPYNISNFPNIFEYDESRVNTVMNAIPEAFAKGWKVPTTATLAVGKGYNLNISAADKVTFNGTLNTGTLPVALTRTGGPDGGWQLVGNPYPAPLDIAAIAAADRTNLDAAFYVFRSTTLYNGYYDSYVNGIGALVAASGQGFFCRVSAGQVAGTLTFRNSQRQTGFNGVNPRFQRGTVDTRPQLRLTLASTASGAAADQAYVYLQTGATAGFDTEFDAAKIANPTGLNLAALAGTERLAISGLPLPTATTLVPLTVGLPAAGTYVLTAADFANFGGTAVVLRDALTGTRTPLAAGTAYRFTAATATANGRFSLELSPAAAPLATAAQALAALVQVYPNPAHGTFHLTLPASAKAATVQVVNALGQVVVTRALTSAEADFSTAHLAAGVYTLRFAVDGTAVARKLVVE